MTTINTLLSEGAKNVDLPELDCLENDIHSLTLSILDGFEVLGSTLISLSEHRARLIPEGDEVKVANMLCTQSQLLKGLQDCSQEIAVRQLHATSNNSK